MLKREETAAVFINWGRERPYIAQRVALDAADCSFLLLITDLNRLAGARAELLEHGFGLTPCEARVAAALSTGMTPSESITASAWARCAASSNRCSRRPAPSGSRSSSPCWRDSSR